MVRNLVFVMVAGLFLASCLVHSPRMEGSQPDLRVLSYNIPPPDFCCFLV